MSLADVSVRRPVTTWVTFFAVVVLGVVCLLQMPVDMLPKMDLPAITVMTRYPGAAPEDVESKITKPLEQALGGVSELKHIASVAKEDVSVITLTFEWGTDLDTRANEVRDLVGMAKISLPEDVEDSRVLKFDVSRFPILIFGVKARESYAKLEKILADEIVDPLSRLPGVAAVMARVPLIRQVNVDVDRERLAAYGLTLSDVARAIVRENVDTPGGDLKVGERQYLLRVPGEVATARDFESIVLTTRQGAVVRLSDVATVEDGFEETQRYVRIDGQRGAMFFVQKESDANTVAVAKAVHRRLAALHKRLPRDVEILTVMDASEDIRLLIRDLSQTLLCGGLLCMLVVLVFLREWRTTAIVSLTLPFSVILGLVANYFLGFTINMITLFSFIIAVGMIVDNAIVVLENIMRHREAGERAREAAVYGAGEVAMPITASTLTTVCIFFPILFVQGITRILFREFAMVVSVTLGASLFTALTMTPMLASQWLPEKTLRAVRSRRLFARTERAFEQLASGYARLLSWSLRHRGRVIGLAGTLFVLSILLARQLGTEFMPQEDRAVVRGFLWMPVGTRVETTAEVMKAIQDILTAEVPEQERVAVFTSCGVSENYMASAMLGEEGMHIGYFGVRLVPPNRRSRSTQTIAARLRRRLDEVRHRLGIEKYRLEVGDPMASLMMAGEQPITVNILGNDLEETDRLAARIRDIVARTPGAVDVTISREKGQPELWVNVDRARASSMGVNVSDVGSAVRAAFYGQTASRYRVHGDEYDVFVRLREADRTAREDLLAVPLRLPSGPLARVGDVASVGSAFGPVRIDRKDQARIVNVTANVQDRSLGDVTADIERAIRALEIPPGVEVRMAGHREEQRESFLWLSFALGIGMVLVYLVMAAQFESWRHPFVVLFSIPFAFTGAFGLLFLRGHPISVVVFLGLLLLVGVVVNNAIVLVDYTNILRARGWPLHEAIPEAGRTRLRPILMTALTTMVAISPMAFGKGQGAENWNPLGATVLGGLIVSTLVTLVLVPVMYSLIEAPRRQGRESGTGGSPL